MSATTCSSPPNPNLFIKISYNRETRRVQVERQSVPRWTKLTNDIASRFDIPVDQPIGLQYFDSDNELITISSQGELDEVWDEMKRGSLIKSYNSILLRPRNRFSLILMEKESLTSSSNFFPFFTPDDLNRTETNALKTQTPPAENKSDEMNPHIMGETSHIQDNQVDYALDGESVSLAALSSQSLASTVNNICTVLEQANLMSPFLQSTIGGYAQMIAEFAGSINNACSVVATRLQNPPTKHNGTQFETPSSAPVSSAPGASDSVNPVHIEGSHLNSRHSMISEASPNASSAVAETSYSSFATPAENLYTEVQEIRAAIVACLADVNKLRHDRTTSFVHAPPASTVTETEKSHPSSARPVSKPFEESAHAVSPEELWVDLDNESGSTESPPNLYLSRSKKLQRLLADLSKNQVVGKKKTSKKLKTY